MDTQVERIMKEGLEHFIQKVTLGLAFEGNIEYFLKEKCQALCHMNRKEAVVMGLSHTTHPNPVIKDVLSQCLLSSTHT